MNQDYAYAYNDENGTMSSMTVTANGIVDTMTYAYDALQRLTSQTTQRSTGLTIAGERSYKTLSGNRTTTQVSSYTAKVNGTAVDSYSYTYDSLGNITAINRNGSSISYGYDAQNQLTSMSEGNINYGYTYDTYGNILFVKKYDVEDEPILLSTDTYSYNDPQWIDRLTAFNGHDIAYDEIGNPLTYYNGSDYAFTWDGRELATAVKGSTSVSFKYGADGLRIQKTVGSTVYNYYYADGLLTRQTWGTNNYIDFLYDESGMVYSCVYNGAQYYYVRNLQGDVTHLLNANGSVAVTYSYDAWGKCTVTSGASDAIANANPIRYRGYYYDTDTGFYYLQSRYYDPTIKRFINADSYINANGDILGFNMYAYCGNNPIMYSDPSGQAIITSIVIGVIIGAVIGGTAGGVIAYNAAKEEGTTGKDLALETLKGVGKGMVFGGLSGGLLAATGCVLGVYGVPKTLVTSLGQIMLGEILTIVPRGIEVGILECYTVSRVDKDPKI